MGYDISYNDEEIELENIVLSMESGWWIHYLNPPQDVHFW